MAHWDRAAALGTSAWSRAYHRRLIQVYRSLIPPGQRVLEIGCGTGDLLAALSPSIGVGVDFSSRMLREATRRHPCQRFVRADAHALDFGEAFDFVILSDLVNDLWDVEVAFKQLARVAAAGSRVIVNFYSRLWEAPLERSMCQSSRRLQTSIWRVSGRSARSHSPTSSSRGPSRAPRHRLSRWCR